LEQQAKSMDEQVAFFRIGAIDDFQETPGAREPTEKPARKQPPSVAPAAMVKALAPPKQQPVVSLKRVAEKGGGGRAVRRMQAVTAAVVKDDAADWKAF
jgi:hypothetical protein